MKVLQCKASHMTCLSPFVFLQLALSTPPMNFSAALSSNQSSSAELDFDSSDDDVSQAEEASTDEEIDFGSAFATLKALAHGLYNMWPMVWFLCEIYSSPKVKQLQEVRI